MAKRNSNAEILAIKDEEDQRPIPSAWRPAFREIVRALARKDYGLKAGIPGVAPLSPKIAKQIKEYVEDYGETLVELSEKTWASSCCLWMGKHWDVLIDLWTKREGRSDLALRARVSESKSGLVIRIEMVYVP